MRNTGTATASGAVSVTVTASRRAIVDSQDGCRYTTQNGPCVAIGFQPVDGSGRSRPGPAENPAPSGCRVRFCAGATSRLRLASRTKCGPGSPGERDAVCCSGYEEGRRRAIGVVAASQSPTHDHADGATLGRRDAKASRRPRRPGMRAATAAATGTEAVSVSVSDRTNPHRYTTIAGGTPALL